jgi:hypothetical protein
MTVPEDNRPKTHTTDQTIREHDDTGSDEKPQENRTMGDALKDAGVDPADYEEGS